MTHSEDEEETKHVFGLPDSAIAITGVDGDCNDFWYRWNLASLSAENWVDLIKCLSRGGDMGRRKSLIPVLQFLTVSYHMSRLTTVLTNTPL